MKTKIRMGKKTKILESKRLQKLLFSDKSYFRVHGKHSRFVRIRKGGQLGPAHFNEVVNTPYISCSGKVLAFWSRFRHAS